MLSAECKKKKQVRGNGEQGKQSVEVCMHVGYTCIICVRIEKQSATTKVRLVHNEGGPRKIFRIGLTQQRLFRNAVVNQIASYTLQIYFILSLVADCCYM